MAAALAVAGRNHQIAWHWRWDPDREHVGGQQLKNEMLDSITDGWVWIYDDDTLIAPNLFNRTAQAIGDDPNLAAIVVAQELEDGRYRHAHPDLVHVGQIDAGQAILRRDLIGDHRLPLSYEGDGHLLETLLPGRDDVLYLNEALSYYNALGVPA